MVSVPWMQDIVRENVCTFYRCLSKGVRRSYAAFRKCFESKICWRMGPTSSKNSWKGKKRGQSNQEERERRMGRLVQRAGEEVGGMEEQRGM